MSGVTIAFFGSSLVSSYWNGAATYYRGILRALGDRGHRITFFEPDAYGRQQHRDLKTDPEYARVVVYRPDRDGLQPCLDQARSADVVVKASGVGVLDAELESAVLGIRRPGMLAVFWDVDAPATLERMQNDPADPFRALVPRYDAVLTYGGGEPVVRAYGRFGARACVPVYNALDPDTHHPVPADERFLADLTFLGNRLPDREARVEEFFLRAATLLPEMRCVLGGAGWGDRALPSNVRWVGHVFTPDHNAFNCSARLVLNVHRESMARVGYSPATRLFEAAGAGAAQVTDAFEGIELFLEPDREVLLAHGGDEVADAVRRLSPGAAAAMGRRARQRVLSEHTYVHRALLVERALGIESAKAEVG